MLLAVDSNGDRLSASPDARALCPSCGNNVVAKCGSIKIWHWSHETSADCDSWGEHETPWHAGWKSKFPVESREVVIGNHRADVFHRGLVVELQHSSISPEEIMDREKFYQRMIWIVDASVFLERLGLSTYGEDYETISWKWPRPSWRWPKCPVFFDIGTGFLFRLLRLSEGGHGWGRMVSHDSLVAWLRDGLQPNNPPPPVSITISQLKNRYIANCPFSQRHILKVAGFQWSPTARYWFTIDPDVASEFQQAKTEDTLQRITNLFAAGSR